MEADGRVPDPLQEIHGHDQWQMYINLSGDVEFMVGNRLYPIAPGSVMLVRPHELHHCIYRKKAEIHKHFCLYFTLEENEKMFRSYFGRQGDAGNLIQLSPQALPALCEICQVLLEKQEHVLAQYQKFLELLMFIKRNEAQEEKQKEIMLPQDIECALKYIDENLSDDITIVDIAAAAHVSVNTLERHFLSAIEMTLHAFLKQRRLHHARRLLRQGKSVSESCEQSGFSDCSHFIALFKKKYGMTPLKFKKSGVE